MFIPHSSTPSAVLNQRRATRRPSYILQRNTRCNFRNTEQKLKKFVGRFLFFPSFVRKNINWRFVVLLTEKHTECEYMNSTSLNVDYRLLDFVADRFLNRKLKRCDVTSSHSLCFNVRISYEVCMINSDFAHQFQTIFVLHCWHS